MTSTPYIPEYGAAAETYLNVRHRIRSWLFTRDHKRIAILYMVSITLFFFVGGAAATIMRLSLMTPDGRLTLPETYNRLFTIHGVTMVWFFLIPSVPTVLGNFLVPLMIGARDMAFPRLNLASWYLFVIGGCFTLAALVAGGVDTGWTFYTPYSSTFSNTHVVLTVTGIFISGFSSILTGLNIIITVNMLRAPGMTWFRLPLFIWSNYATAIILVLATPVLAMTLALVAVERVFHVGIFDPALGGNPLLFQHLFWFYSHPAVYIMILPGMGVVSELVTCFSRHRVFGYEFVAWSSVGIAVIGFLVWGHHMFVAGMSVYGGMVFSFLSFLVAVPSAIKVFNWTATLYGGSVSLKTPMLYALGFIGLFVLGGVTGLFLATLAVDVHLTDTYFVVAHFHYIMVGGMVMAYMGGIHFWWPKMTGRMYPEWAGRLSAGIIFMGFNLTFFPQYVLGYLGMPRRYHAYPDEFQVLNVMSTAGASILAVGYLMPLCYLLWSLRYGPVAEANPWKAMGLEWTTSSPPPPENFAMIPVIREEAYAYDRMTPQGSNNTLILPGPTGTSGTRPEGAMERAMNHGGTVFEHDSLPAEQFVAVEQQRETASLGMWTFLATEVLFFGVLFTGFFVYRTRWPDAFKEGAHELKWWLGAINTAVLLGSSYCMALAVHAASTESSAGADNRRIVRWLWLTIALGVLFLLIKGTEYTIEWHDRLIPYWHWSDVSADGRERADQLPLFMTFYFVMTMLHAIHMVIGVGVLGTVLVLAKRRHFTPDYHHPVEVVGLYWHFVDTVWVFLFPTLYLLRH